MSGIETMAKALLKAAELIEKGRFHSL